MPTKYQQPRPPEKLDASLIQFHIVELTKSAQKLQLMLTHEFVDSGIADPHGKIEHYKNKSMTHVHALDEMGINGTELYYKTCASTIDNLILLREEKTPEETRNIILDRLRRVE